MKAVDLKIGDKIMLDTQALIVSNVLIQVPIGLVFVDFGKKSARLNINEEISLSKYREIKAHDLIHGQSVLVNSSGNISVTSIVKIKNNGNNISLFLWNGEIVNVNKNDKSLTFGGKIYNW